MTTVSQPAYFNLQALDSLGALGVGMRLYTYTQGTTTHKTAYTDAAGTVPFTYTSDGAGGQYIAMDARGELSAPLYLTAGSYDLALKTSAGATVWTRRVDPAWSDLAASSGAVGDGVTDDAAALQAALDTGLRVELGKKSYLINSPLSVPSGGGLIGEGMSQYPPAAYIGDVTVFAGATRLVAGATFPAGRAMVEVKTTAGADYAIQGVEVSGLVIDCNSIAEQALTISTVKHSVFKDLFLRLPVVTGLTATCNSVANTTIKGNNATQFNEFTNITVMVAYSSNVTSATGITLTGNVNNNINQNNWTNIYVVHGNGNGIELRNCDADLWSRVNTLAWGTGYGCVMYGDDTGTTEFCRNTTMIGVQFSGAYGTGGVIAKAGATQSSNWNVIFGYSEGNGAPAPIVEDGARLSWYTEMGPVIADPTLPTLTLKRTAAFVTGNSISDTQHVNKITAGTATTFVRERAFVRGGSGTEYGEMLVEGYNAGATSEVLKYSSKNGLAVGGGTGILKILSATASLDFPSIAAQNTQTLTMTVTGAKVGDAVFLGIPSNGLNAQIALNGWVSAADTVSIKAMNISTGAIDPGNQSFRATVFNYT
jgi:hypothetical protein